MAPPAPTTDDPLEWFDRLRAGHTARAAALGERFIAADAANARPVELTRGGPGDARAGPDARLYVFGRDAVRSRARPVCDIETGHRSTTAALLGNIAYRTGRAVRWDARAERIVGDAEASGYLAKTYGEPWRLEV